MQPLDGRDLVASNSEPIPRLAAKEYPCIRTSSRAQEHLEKPLRIKLTFELEHRVYRPDGSIGWTFSRAVPILDAAGNIIEWFGTRAT